MQSSLNADYWQLFFMILILQEVMTICTGRVTQAVAALEARGSVNGAGVLAKVSNILLVLLEARALIETTV
jgi:hypothetical protein